MTFDSPEDGPGSGSASIGAISPAIVALEGLLPPGAIRRTRDKCAGAQVSSRSWPLPNFSSVLRARAKFPSLSCLFFRSFVILFVTDE
jgi:hypothetical protein